MEFTSFVSVVIRAHEADSFDGPGSQNAAEWDLTRSLPTEGGSRSAPHESQCSVCWRQQLAPSDSPPSESTG